MTYTPTVWRNGQTPAINAPNLNKIEQGIKQSFDENPFAKDNFTYPYQKFFGFSSTDRADFCKIPGRNHFYTASISDGSVLMMNTDYNTETNVSLANYAVSVCYLPELARLVGVRYYSNSGIWIVYATVYSDGTISSVTELKTPGIPNGNEDTRVFNYDGSNLGIYTRVYSSSNGYTHTVSYRSSTSTSSPTTVFSFTESNSADVHSVFKKDSFFYFLQYNGELKKYNSNGVLQTSGFLNKTLVGRARGADYADGKLYVMGSGQHIGVTTLPF